MIQADDGFGPLLHVSCVISLLFLFSVFCSERVCVGIDFMISHWVPGRGFCVSFSRLKVSASSLGLCPMRRA